MKIAELVDRFVKSCEQNKAANSAAFYKSRLRLFRAAYQDRELGELTPLEIDDHLAAAGEGKSNSTRRSNAVALELLQSWALEKRVLAAPVFDKLPKPPMGQRSKIPTKAETAAILTKGSPAFRLIYRALRLSGARPEELCSAQISDYDVAAGEIVRERHKTVGKTGRPRRIPVGGQLAKILATAIGGRTAGAIFLSPRGKPWKPAHLSRSYRRIREKLQLPDDLVLYLARHECGTELTKKKGIKFAQDALGHASIKTTQRYAHLEREDLQNAQDLIADCDPSNPTTDLPRAA